MTDHPDGNGNGDKPGPYRSLFERLMVLADHLPVSHIVDHTAVGKFVAALAHYAEFGESVLDAADEAAQHIAHQLVNVSADMRRPAPQVADVLTEPFGPPVDTGDSDGRIAALEQQLALLQAQQVNRDSTVTSTAVGTQSEPQVPTGGPYATDVPRSSVDPQVPGQVPDPRPPAPTPGDGPTYQPDADALAAPPAGDPNPGASIPAANPAVPDGGGISADPNPTSPPAAPGTPTAPRGPDTDTED